jgi:hypothetical protein
LFWQWQLFVVLKPPGPAATDDPIGFRSGGFMNYPSAKFSCQLTGELMAELLIVQ